MKHVNVAYFLNYRVFKVLSEGEDPCFRIGLRTKGCNGMAYTLEHAPIESKQKFEEVVSFHYWS